MQADETPPAPWPFFARLLVAAFCLNWLWEMAQMPAYAEMAGRPWRETTLWCTRASVADAAVTLGIWGVGALAAGAWRWGMKATWHVYATGALLGMACATGLEWQALRSGRWSYTEGMPLVPVLDVGLWPFLQLTLLVPAALRIAAWRSAREAG
ncbi:MAG: hypothetical protein L0Z62_45075 [Gemmataceae bacterium]|nr:hypothetical protein [Gemmataceae bacterium]